MQITSLFAWYRAGKLLLRCCLVPQSPEVCNHRLNGTGAFILCVGILSWCCRSFRGGMQSCKGDIALIRFLLQRAEAVWCLVPAGDGDV